MRTATRTEHVPHPMLRTAEQHAAGAAATGRLAYRPALDGIRALAVLAVFAYHLGYTRGGFLGVDVFFVLSGYLITSLLLLEHDATGRIALLAFWGRRARRLLPAVLLVILAVALWVHATAPAFELAQRRQDLLWTLFYGSNWNLIASAQDYFAQFESASLVRHTWSLGIEEQFYLLWPILVLVAIRLGRARTRVLAAVCSVGLAVSLGLMALLYAPGDPSRAYYGTETRAHQMLIGALLAILMIRSERAREPRRAGVGVAAAATVGLLAAFAMLGDANAAYYRGLSALVALLAAALIWGLEVAPAGAVARGFSLAPMRWIGRISYGVYLWHWPVIVAITVPAAAFTWLPGTTALSATRVLLTFAVAALSFVLVERPIREGAVPVLGRSLARFAFAAVGIMVVVTVSIGSLTAAPSSLTASEGWGSKEIDDLGCSLQICVRHHASEPGAPVVAVVGDSIARSLDVGFLDLARREGWTYVIAATGGCRVTHLLTFAGGQSERYEPCYEQAPALFSKVLQRWRPDVVIELDHVELADYVDATGRVVPGGSAEHLEAERGQIEAVASTFTSTGARLVFVALTPVVAPRDCLREETLDIAECSVPASLDPLPERFNTMLRSIADGFPGRAFVVSVNDRICPEGRCPPKVDGVFLRYDGHHFTSDGARWVVPLLYEEMRRVGALPSSMA